MALSPYQLTIYTKEDNPYNVVPDAPVEIRVRLTNGTSGGLATIYSDQAGTIPITQVGAKADSNGQFLFYAEAAQYNAVYGSKTVPLDVGLTADSLPTSIINNLSLPYLFDTATAYQASSIIFPLNKIINISSATSGGGTGYTIVNGNTGAAGDYYNSTTLQSIALIDNTRMDMLIIENKKKLQLNQNYLNATNPTKNVTNSQLTARSTQYKPKLVILLGQSNAEGRGTSADANANNDTTGTRSSVQVWNSSAFEDLYVPRTNAETGNNDALAGRYGIELGVANYAEYNNETIYMVKVTDGGTFMGQWLATEDIIPVGGGDPNDPENDGDLSIASPTGGVLDNEAWTKVQNAQVAMDSLFGSGNYEEVLVMLQGEANGGSPTQRPRFKRQRITFNSRWRTRLTSTLRIIYAHILAVDAGYIEVNGLMNKIDYEDPLTYVIENTEHLQSNDNLHLNYFGLCQMSKRVYDEVRSPTSKAIAYPNGRVDTIQAAQTLNIEEYTDVLIVEGTTSIRQSLGKEQARNGRILKLWRNFAGPGVLISHDFGDPNVYANFRFISGVSTSLAANTERWFRGYEGHWYEINVVSG